MLTSILVLQLMLPFSTVVQGDMTNVDGPREVVIRTTEEWQELWRQHGADEPEPQADFARQTILGVFLGTRPSAGFRVEITAVRREDGETVIEYLERRPAAGMMVASVLTMPYQIVRVERLDGPIRFVRLDSANRQ